MLCAHSPALAVEYVFPEDANVIDVKSDFGAKGDGETDDTEAIMKAVIHSLSEDRYNPEFIYFPNGIYLVSDTIQNRVPDHKWSDGWLVVVHNCDKTLVIRHCDLKGYENTERGTGDVFIEDIMGGHPRINAPQNMWARQLNSEYGRIPQFINNGGKAWILGMKCESKMPLIINNAGVVECYALYSMTNPMPDRTTPMFVNKEGRMAVSFADGGQKSYWTKIKETQGGQTRLDQTWRRETMMYIGGAPGK